MWEVVSAPAMVSKPPDCKVTLPGTSVPGLPNEALLPEMASSVPLVIVMAPALPNTPPKPVPPVALTVPPNITLLPLPPSDDKAARGSENADRGRDAEERFAARNKPFRALRRCLVAVGNRIPLSPGFDRVLGILRDGVRRSGHGRAI